ncbi:hypothetical protein Hypma_012568 [Hypsizygus marmoreus]|uniref:Uncharacterized protein n=1 Tax=Hypsizygus marmoreus TaxID=39966 RepID=A0A369JLJ2_HYPMA|nr:hypothetical protein Hypma_012568 [Hypsizygus marmoreus]
MASPYQDSSVTTPPTLLQPVTLTILLPLVTTALEYGRTTLWEYVQAQSPPSSEPVLPPTPVSDPAPPTLSLFLPPPPLPPTVETVRRRPILPFGPTYTKASPPCTLQKPGRPSVPAPPPTPRIYVPTPTTTNSRADEPFLSAGVKYGLVVIVCLGIAIASVGYVATKRGYTFTPISADGKGSDPPEKPTPRHTRDDGDGTGGSGSGKGGGKDDKKEDEEEEVAEEEKAEETDEEEKEKEEIAEEEEVARALDSAGNPGEPDDPNDPPDDPQNNDPWNDAPQSTYILQQLVLLVVALVLVKRLDIFEQSLLSLWHAWRQLARGITKKLGVQHVARDVRETVVGWTTTKAKDVSVSPVLVKPEVVLAEVSTNTNVTVVETASATLVMAAAALPTTLQLIMGSAPQVIPHAFVPDIEVMREEKNKVDALLGLLGVEPVCVTPRVVNAVVEEVRVVEKEVEEAQVIEAGPEMAAKIVVEVEESMEDEVIAPEDPEPVPTDAKGWGTVAVHVAAVGVLLRWRRLVNIMRREVGDVDDDDDAAEEVDYFTAPEGEHPFERDSTVAAVAALLSAEEEVEEEERVDDDAASEASFLTADPAAEYAFGCGSTVAVVVGPLSEEEEETAEEEEEEDFLSFDLGSEEGMEEGKDGDRDVEEEFVSFQTVAEEIGSEEEEEFVSFEATTIAEEDEPEKIGQEDSVDFLKLATSTDKPTINAFPFASEDDLDAWFTLLTNTNTTAAIPLDKDAAAEPTPFSEVDASVASGWVTQDAVDGDDVELELERLEDLAEVMQLSDDEELPVVDAGEAMEEENETPGFATQERDDNFAISVSLSFDIVCTVDSFWRDAGKDETNLLAPSFSMDAALSVFAARGSDDEKDAGVSDLVQTLEPVVVLEGVSQEVAVEAEVELLGHEEEETEAERTRRAVVAEGKKKELAPSSSTPASTRRSSFDPLVPAFTPSREGCSAVPVHRPASPSIIPRADTSRKGEKEPTITPPLNPHARPFILPFSSAHPLHRSPYPVPFPWLWSPSSTPVSIKIAAPLTSAERREARRVNEASSSDLSPSPTTRGQRKRRRKAMARTEVECTVGSVGAEDCSTGEATTSDIVSLLPLARRQSEPPPFSQGQNVLVRASLSMDTLRPS